jgi:putative membrane protein
MALQKQLQQISYRQIGWAYCLSRSLRKQDPLGFERSGAPVETFISAKDKSIISHHQNKPLALANLQGEGIGQLHHQGYLNDFQQVEVDQTMTRLVESMGQAERIKNTIFPVTYRQILIGFIYIFLIIMSMALLELDSIWEIPVDLVISLPFFMIEKTARFMQDPFENKPTDTAMTTIAKTIELNIKQIWQDQQLPEAQDLSDEYYIL